MNYSLKSPNVKHVITRVIACSVMLLVLPSCGIPHLRKAERGPGLPEGFKGSTGSDNSSQLTIEEFYNDSNLTWLIDQAVANNRELKVLNEDVQIAGNDHDRIISEILSATVQTSAVLLPVVGILLAERRLRGG